MDENRHHIHSTAGESLTGNTHTVPSMHLPKLRLKKKNIKRKEESYEKNWTCQTIENVVTHFVCLFFCMELFPMFFFPPCHIVTTSGRPEDEEHKHYKSWACTIIGPVSMPNKEMEELRLGSAKEMGNITMK